MLEVKIKDIVITITICITMILGVAIPMQVSAAENEYSYNSELYVFDTTGNQGYREDNYAPYEYNPQYNDAISPDGYAPSENIYDDFYNL